MKFRKKPVVIEAEQFFAAQKPWPAGVVHLAHHQIEGWCLVPYPWTPISSMWGSGRFSIQTLEGSMEVSEGDWIITGVKGERYPCKPEIFAQTYEPVEDDAA